CAALCAFGIESQSFVQTTRVVAFGFTTCAPSCQALIAAIWVVSGNPPTTARTGAFPLAAAAAAMPAMYIADGAFRSVVATFGAFWRPSTWKKKRSGCSFASWYV